jgi:hypothetical protein
LSEVEAAESFGEGKVVVMTCFGVHVPGKLEIRIGRYVDRFCIVEAIFSDPTLNVELLIDENRSLGAIPSNAKSNVNVGVVGLDLKNVVHLLENEQDAIVAARINKSIVNEDK